MPGVLHRARMRGLSREWIVYLEHSFEGCENGCMSIPSETLAAIADVSVAFAPPTVGALDDGELLADLRVLSEMSRRVDALTALYAHEVSVRSRRELGHDGLAQRLGVRTPERLVQRVTGATRGEARQLLRVGEVTAPPSSASEPDLPSWLGAVGDAVRAGVLSIAGADAIRSGIGTPCEGVPAEALARAAARLVGLATSLTVEQLAAEARHARDELDEAGIADRAARMRQKRFLHITLLPDGMTRLAGLLDPESAAIVTAAYDGATSPRRGGPRFVDAEAAAVADRIRDDERSTEQLALDAFVELLRLGAAIDPGRVLPARRPEVTLHVTARDLDRRAGAARFEGQTSSVSIQAAQRRICDSGYTPILFDNDRRVLDAGRSRRLFTTRQRLALAARDGGCAHPDCDRPPSWCEAHHLLEWSDGGATSIDNGVLLCRHHHLLVHDHGWIIRRTPDGRWAFAPPAPIARERTSLESRVVTTPPDPRVGT